MHNFFFFFFLTKLADGQQLTAESTIADDTCQTRDPAFATNAVCEPSQWTKKIKLLSFLTIHLNSSCSCGLSVALQILLFLHAGLSASQDHSLYPAVWGKHTHLRSKLVHPLCLLQRSGAAVWERQPCLEHLEGHHIMRWVLCVDAPQMVHFTTPHCCCGWFISRGASLSGRPCLCGAGASLSPKLLQPQPCTFWRGSRQLLCLPDKWESPVLTFHSTHLSLSTS